MLFASSSHSIDRIDGDHRERPIGGESVSAPVPEPVGRKAAATPSRQSQRGLDWFIFFLADVQPGFGPFIRVYLTTQKWTQVEIGPVLVNRGAVRQVRPCPA